MGMERFSEHGLIVEEVTQLVWLAMVRDLKIIEVIYFSGRAAKNGSRAWGRSS